MTTAASGEPAAQGRGGRPADANASRLPLSLAVARAGRDRYPGLLGPRRRRKRTSPVNLCAVASVVMGEGGVEGPTASPIWAGPHPSPAPNAAAPPKCPAAADGVSNPDRTLDSRLRKALHPELPGVSLLVRGPSPGPFPRVLDRGSAPHIPGVSMTTLLARSGGLAGDTGPLRTHPPRPSSSLAHASRVVGAPCRHAAGVLRRRSLPISPEARRGARPISRIRRSVCADTRAGPERSCAVPRLLHGLNHDQRALARRYRLGHNQRWEAGIKTLRHPPGDARTPHTQGPLDSWQVAPLRGGPGGVRGGRLQAGSTETRDIYVRGIRPTSPHPSLRGWRRATIRREQCPKRVSRRGCGAKRPIPPARTPALPLALPSPTGHEPGRL